MENRFELYMNESTEKICTLLSSPDLSIEERELIISSFSKELTDSICNTDLLPEYNYIFDRTSAGYIDKRLSFVLGTNSLSYSDYNDTLKLCSRQQDIFCLFEDKKWELPLLDNVDIDYVTNNIKQKRDTYGVINQIAAWDSEITGLFSKVHTDPDVKTYSFILQRIDDFDELLDKCRKDGLKLPPINNKNTKKLRKELSGISVVAKSRDEIYQRIISIDKQIVDITKTEANSKANMQELISLCETQNSQLSECANKRFKLPQITISSPSKLITKYSHFIEMIDLDEEISTNQSLLKSQRQYSKFINICNQQERNISLCSENNWLIPDISVQHPEVLAHDAEIALSKKIRNDKIKAILIAIGFLVVIVIVCKCINTKDISAFLNDWQSTNYEDIYKKLNAEGFSNVTTNYIDTFDLEQDNLIKDITINGKSFTGERTYTSLNARVEIFYYTFKIRIKNNNSGFKGKEYTNVVNDLKNSGFKNVQTKVVNNGWAKGNSIVELSVNNTTKYNANDSFEPDVKIVVRYSSNDRINAAKCVENFSNKKYIDVQNAFKSAGFTNVKVIEKDTFSRSEHNLVSSLKINGSEYNNENYNGCFVQKTAPIIIEYYVVRKIEVGGSAEDFKINEENNYLSVVSSLKNKGFTNILLLRNDKLITGWVTKEGSIESIAIDGNGNFSAIDEFYKDDKIEIVVNTFKDKGCSDITKTVG